MRVRHIILLLAVGAVLYLAFFPSGHHFVAFAPEPPPAWTGTLTPNSPLDSLRSFGTVGDGPEDLALDATGTLYTGIADGHLMTFTPGEKNWRALTVTYGRPLGLAFSPDERWLYIADAERGLMRTDKQGHLERLVDTLDGQDLGLVDDLAVARDGTVYFTTASTEWGWAESRDAMLAHHGTGMLLRYDPHTRVLDLLMDSLQFANGVAIAPDGQSLFVAETGGYRVWRYGLAGRDSGRVSVFADNLPGFPDGLNYDDDGLLWVSVPNRRNALLDALAPYPQLREAVYLLPERFKPQPERYGLILALDENGSIVRSLHGPAGDFSAITNVVWRRDTAYFGSLSEREVRWGTF